MGSAGHEALCVRLKYMNGWCSAIFDLNIHSGMKEHLEGTSLTWHWGLSGGIREGRGSWSAGTGDSQPGGTTARAKEASKPTVHLRLCISGRSLSGHTGLDLEQSEGSPFIILPQPGPETGLSPQLFLLSQWTQGRQLLSSLLWPS